MDIMDAATVDGKVPVKGTRVGNLFVHYRLGLSRQRRDYFVIAHFKSGRSISHGFDMPKLKANVIALAKKIDAAIPEFEHDEAWMLANLKPVGKKLRQLVTIKQS